MARTSERLRETGWRVTSGTPSSSCYWVRLERTGDPEELFVGLAALPTFSDYPEPVLALYYREGELTDERYFDPGPRSGLLAVATPDGRIRFVHRELFYRRIERSSAPPATPTEIA